MLLYFVIQLNLFCAFIFELVSNFKRSFLKSSFLSSVEERRLNARHVEASSAAPSLMKHQKLLSEEILDQLTVGGAALLCPQDAAAVVQERLTQDEKWCKSVSQAWLWDTPAPGSVLKIFIYWKVPKVAQHEPAPAVSWCPTGEHMYLERKPQLLSQFYCEESPTSGRDLALTSTSLR